MASVSSEGGEQLELNIMPMLDIFSILITFLLMSYSTEPVQPIPAGVEVPDSLTLAALDEVPLITVKKDEIVVNDKKVASVFNGDVAEKDQHQGAVLPVFTELEKLMESNKRACREQTSLEKDDCNTSTITMVVDKAHRFKLMKRVMLAAQQAEFITIKLAVGRGGP